MTPVLPTAEAFISQILAETLLAWPIGGVLCARAQESGGCLYETPAPGKLVLAQTLERVKIPNDLVGLVEGRSSYARVGITIHITAPKIDPGFEGHITLEMVNLGNIPVELRARVDRPAQLILARLSNPLGDGEAYGSGASDTFQYQEDPIPRRRPG